MFLVCCHPNILLPWQHDVKTSPLIAPILIYHQIPHVAFRLRAPVQKLIGSLYHFVQKSFCHNYLSTLDYSWKENNSCALTLSIWEIKVLRRFKVSVLQLQLPLGTTIHAVIPVHIVIRINFKHIILIHFISMKILNYPC